MDIVTFELCHTAEAVFLAEKQLNDVCAAVSALQKAPLPDLHGLANGLGVAAMENGRMAGYLCAYGPFKGMFGTWGTGFEDQFVGVFSPIEAHAVAADASVKTWQRMYQAAAARWVQAGAAYHAIALYEHDALGKSALFRYGFGQRCADAIRRVEPLGAAPVPGISCCELPQGSAGVIRELRRGLDAHLCQSPCFMARTEESTQKWLDAVQHRDSRLFAAMAKGRVIAFIEVTEEGENFLTARPEMLNICGAYCEPAWRGKGVSRLLLDFVLHTLQDVGISWLGVDYEAMNPMAAGFWEKYFEPYTASLVRRMDCTL